MDIEELTSEKLAEEQQRGSTPGIHKTWIRETLQFLVDAAKHPQVSAEILQKISQYPSPEIKLAITQNSNAPEALKLELLEELAIHNDYQIRKKLAEDTNTPTSILKLMVNHESYENKLRREIRRVFTSEYPENSHSYEGTADKLLSDLKYEVLYPANVTINIEQWIELITNSEIWEIMMDDTTLTDSFWSGVPSIRQLIERKIYQCTELLPNLPQASFTRFINTICDILGLTKSFVKNHQFMRSVGVALVGNPNTPPNLIEELKNQLLRPNRSLSDYKNDRYLFTALAYNPSIPEAERIEYFQQIIAAAGNHEDIAINPKTPVEILLQIMSQPGSNRQAISRNPNAPTTALAQLAEDDNNLTRGWVAENPGTPVEILIKLARLPIHKKVGSNVVIDRNVREAVFKNPHFPPLERYNILLEEDAVEETAKAHQLMARRSDSPYALAQVLEKGDRNAKITAVRSPKTPIHILEQLAKDADESIRSIVLENSNLPLSSHLKLTQDASVNVRANLASHRKNRTVPIQVLEILARDNSSRVRTQVASNPDTPIEILNQLAFDSDSEVLNALTRNQNTPVNVLEYLGVEKGIVNIYNAKTPGTALEKAVENALKPNVYGRDKILDNLLRSVQGSQMPAHVLAKLANYKTSWVRSSVAAHPNTPISALEPPTLQ